MDFFEAIILFMIVRGVINLFGASKKKSSSKEKRSSQTQFQPRTPNKSSSQNPYQTKAKEQRGRDLTSILSNLQKQFEELEGQSKSTSKKTSYAETVVSQDKSRGKDVQILKPQILKTNNKGRLDELYEGMGNLAEEKITVEEMEDYQEALYGDLDDDSLFDYDAPIDMEAEWESDEAAKIIDILEDKEALLDLKTAIIFSEILGKPVSMRK